MPRFTPTPASVTVPATNPRSFPPPPPAPGAATAQAAAAGGANPMTLDALMMRQKEIAGQQQGAGGLNNGTIWGGLGSMAQQFLGGVRQRGVENEINQAQQDISGNLAGAFDPATGEINQQAFGAIGARSPETAMQVYQMALQARQNAAELDLQRQKLAADAGGGAWKPSDLGSLRDDYAKAAQLYDQASPTWQSMQDAAKLALDPAADTKGRGTADYNMIVGFAKLLDPGSVVREGEVQSASMTEGMLNQVQSMLNQWTSNGQLNDETRRAIMTQANSRMRSYYDQAATKRQWVTGVAQRHGVNPDDVVPPMPAWKDWGEQAQNPPITDPAQQNEAYEAARKAVAEGRDRNIIRQRLLDAGLDPSKVGL